MKEPRPWVWRKNTAVANFKVRTGAGALTDSVYAASLGLQIPLGVVDRNPPEIKVDYPAPVYFSPNNDGKKDALVLPITLNDERYLKTYVLEIKDSAGTVVRQIKNKDERPENEGLANFLDKLLEVKSGIAVPESLRWDGNTDAGTQAADGAYTFVLKAVDDNLNEGASESFTVHIDTTAPAVALTALEGPALLFSPDGDGNKDEIALMQTGSSEDRWKATILNSFGAEVRSFTFENAQPGKVVWDGKDNLGQPVPDGVYSYLVTSTDRGDNTVSARQDNILVNTQVTPVVITLNYSHFSPNSDGTRDSLELLPNIPVKEGIKSWSLEILDRGQKALRTLVDDSGKLPSATLYWDGKTDAGQVAPEGNYVAKLSLEYLKGNKPLSTSPSFVLDNTPPTATVLIEGAPAFSPDGDGQRDQLPLRQTSSQEELWTGQILDAAGTAVKTWTWTGRPQDQLAWDGLNDQGQLQKDGEYTFALRSTDRAGNPFRVATAPFKMDTEAKQALLVAEGTAFSPNGDGSKDNFSLIPSTKNPQGLKSWTVVLTDRDNKTVRTFQGGASLDKRILWDGLNDQGTKSADGIYRAKLKLTYITEQTAEASSAAFTLDTQFPEASVDLPYALFSPNGDGKKDTLVIKNATSQENQWTARILSAGNKVLKTWTWTGKAADTTWDGKDESGNLAPDGTYAYEIASEDPAGNRTLVNLPGVKVDSRTVNLFLTLDKAAFSPAQSGNAGQVRMNLVTTLNEGIATWSLKMVHKTQGLVKEFTGTGALPAQIAWDGKNDKGPVEGSYQGELTVVYAKGDEPKVSSTAFLVDASAPEAVVSLSPDLFSPDNDGFADELTIGLAVQDLVGVDNWSLRIREPEGALFMEFSGKDAPASQIIWDGRSRSGEMVQAAVDYPYELLVTDKLGQTKSVKGLIPVDVLVIKDGERYKIAVPSITFAPNAAPILNDGSDAAKKNIQVLSRVAQILNRFGSYRVLIEGHANATQIQSDEARQREDQTILRPLSLGRANAVKDQLVKNGVATGRLTVEGLGGSRPVVSNSDRANVWKNRRVEFILLR